ncbi:Ankyrin [Mycena sanguinolenta]|uniref:Ankyrin n=1 Tax=Mycena sanguinolenta TaxID=230812 RepID=A0A8H7CIY6_9AGAR|nr:Ankyrin [Mycena sanguinolenta]
MLSGLPQELKLHIVSFLTREITIDPHRRLPGNLPHRDLVPDLPSINALSRTNTVFYHSTNQSLYRLCAAVEPLGRLALLFAVEHSLESTLDKLVAAGLSLDADFLLWDKPQWRSLLHIAAARGCLAMVVKLLGMYGEDMAARVHTRGRYLIKTALDCAAANGHLDIVKLLAPIPVPSPDARSIPPPVSDRLETQEEYLSTALMHAASHANLEICRCLVAEGANANFSGLGVGAPLRFAIGSRNLALVQFMLTSGAEPNPRSFFPPLFKAASFSCMDIVEELLAAGASVLALDDQSSNVIAYAATLDILRLFLERGVDPNLRDIYHNTPLHHACYKDYSSTTKAWVEALVQFGASVEATDDAGVTPVDIAMCEDLPDVVKILEPHVRDPGLKLKIATWWKEREEKDD